MAYTGPSKHEIYYQIAKYNGAYPEDWIHLVQSTITEVDRATVKSLETHEKFMRKNYSLLQRNTEVFISKLNKIMDMETNEQAMSMNWDLLIQEAVIMLDLLKKSKLEMDAELSKLAKEVKAESQKEYNESHRGKERTTFSFLGASFDSQIARELQKQEENQFLASVKKVPMMSKRECREQQLQECYATVDRLESSVTGALDSIERVKGKMDKLRHEIQLPEHEEREAKQKEVSATESKMGDGMIMQAYQLLADRKATDNNMALLEKERLESQHLINSLEAAETRRMEDRKLTRLQEKERERGRSPVEKENRQRVTPIIMNASPNRNPYINVQPPAMETQKEQTARRDRERQRLDEENRQWERENREGKETDREREDRDKRRRERENIDRKQREDVDRKRREKLANPLVPKSVPDLRVLPEGVRHVTPSTAEQAIRQDRQKNHGTRDPSPTPSIRSQQEREREARKKAFQELAKEKPMIPADLMPPAKAEAANIKLSEQTPAGSPKTPDVFPAEAGPTALPVKKQKTSLNKEIRFNVPPGGKAESVAESTPTAKKLRKRSIEDLRKHVNRAENEDKKLNVAHYVAMRLASEVRKYEPEERKDCSEMPKIRPLEAKYG